MELVISGFLMILLAITAALWWTLGQPYRERWLAEARSRKLLFATFQLAAWSCMDRTFECARVATRLVVGTLPAWLDLTFSGARAVFLVFIVFSLFEVNERRRENRNLQPPPATVMVVDDEPNVSALMTMALTEAGYNVISADSAGIALRIFSVRTPALVVLDMLLRGSSGAEFLSRVRQIPSGVEVPIVVITGDATTATGLRRYGIRDEDVLLKPFSPLSLVDAVRSRIG